jgi:hypothetical protein
VDREAWQIRRDYRGIIHISHLSGRCLPTADAWMYEVGLAVEVDSREHHLPPADWDRTGSPATVRRCSHFRRCSSGTPRSSAAHHRGKPGAHDHGKLRAVIAAFWFP